MVDVETTGSNPEYNRVVEIGAVKITGGKIVDTFHSLVHPERKVPFFISFMTGISSRMLRTSPRFFHIAEDLKKFLAETIFVAHDARFDYEFLKTEFTRANYPSFYLRTLCTIKLARRVFPGFARYNLRDLSSNLGIPLDRAHRALDDCLATAKIFLLMLKQLEASGVNTIQDLERIYKLSPQECREFFARRSLTAI